MASPAQSGRIYQFGAFRLVPVNGVLFRGEEVVSLSPNIVKTLNVLVARHGRVVSREELLREVWPDTFVEESNLTHNISVLRKALGEGPGDQQYIQTVPKRGYRFVAAVREVDDRLAGEEASFAKLAVLPAPVARPAWRRPALLAAGVAVLIGLGALGYFLVRPAGRATPAKANFTQLTDQPGQELYPSLSPDGNLFVYASRASGNWDIHLQRVGGRNVINLTRDCPLDDTQPAFSPDGQHIAFRSGRDGGGVFVMGATGESVKRVTDFGYYPAWSSDGSEIVCATADFWRPDYRRSTGSRLYVVRLEASSGSARQRPVAGAEDAVQPAWSPHGHRIAYWGLRGGNRDIWTVPAQGGQPVAVTADPHLDWNPVWSPDGNYLYYASDRAGSMSVWRVRIAEESGKPLATPELVTTPSPYSGHFSFSRDGRRMCYVQHLLTANLQKVSFDPLRERALGQPVLVSRGSTRVGTPDLSPDGQWLAFCTRTAKEDVFLVRADGTGLRQLTDDVDSNRAPRWSPDGSRLAYLSARSGKYEIWTMNPDGSSARQLTYESRGPALSPLWSPDGRRLVYNVQGLGAFIIEVEKPWAEQSPQALGAPSEPGVWFCARSWSRDGRGIVGDLQGPTGGYSGVGIYSLESRTLRRLTEFGGVARWLSDCRRLMFHDEQKIYLLDTRSGKVREILSVAPHELGSIFTLARDDRLIVFPVEVTEADVWLMSLR